MATARIEKEAAPQIYGLITEVKRKAGALAPEKTTGVPFPFRGIDGTVNHLAPHLLEAGIITVPTVLESRITSREAGQRVVKTAEVLASFTFYAPDGSSVTATTSGLADDFADRAAAQAQSVAFRVALLQTFFLPTQGQEPEQTGQAVEDGRAGKNTTPRAVTQATKAAPRKPATSPLKGQIAEYIQSGVLTSEEANERVNATGLKGDAAYQKVLDDLKAGVVE